MRCLWKKIKNAEFYQTKAPLCKPVYVAGKRIRIASDQDDRFRIELFPQIGLDPCKIGTESFARGVQNDLGDSFRIAFGAFHPFRHTGSVKFEMIRKFCRFLFRSPDIHTLDSAESVDQIFAEIARSAVEIQKDIARVDVFLNPVLQCEILLVVDLAKTEGRMLAVPGRTDFAFFRDFDLHLEFTVQFGPLDAEGGKGFIDFFACDFAIRDWNQAG